MILSSHLVARLNVSRLKVVGLMDGSDLFLEWSRKNSYLLLLLNNF